MSRFCTKHLPERSTAEIKNHLADAEAGLIDRDPRSAEGKRFLRKKLLCQQELQKRAHPQ